MAREVDGRFEIYDISRDEFRPLTLDDVNRMELCLGAFGKLRQASLRAAHVALEMAQGKRQLADIIPAEHV